MSMMPEAKFRRLVVNDVWNLPSTPGPLDSKSMGARMVEEERRDRAEDRKQFEQRRLVNLRQWRLDVAAAKKAGVKREAYDKPLTFNELTAYNPPKPAFRNVQQQRDRDRNYMASRVY